MKTIYIRAYKVVETRLVGSSRRSGGTLYYYTEITSCEIWSSLPFDFYGNEGKYCRYINKYISTKDSPKDLLVDDDWGDNYIVVSPEWTAEICAILDFGLSEQNLEFKANTSDENNNCHFKLSFENDFDTRKTFCKFIGRDNPDHWGKPRAYSPFNTLEELKHGIEPLHCINNEIPDNWLSFLIINSTEDLSSYLRSLKVDLTHKNIIMFNPKGFFYESIKNYEKLPKLEKSYQDACLNNDKRTIYWYEWRGAGIRSIF